MDRIHIGGPCTRSKGGSMDQGSMFCPHPVFLGLSFRGLNFQGLSFRGLSCRGLNFRGLSFRGLRVLGFRSYM